MPEYGEEFNIVSRFTGLFIPRNILSSTLSDQEKMLLGELLQCVGEDGVARPKNEVLCEKFRWEGKKLNETFASLKAKRLLKSHKESPDTPEVHRFVYQPLYDL